MSSDVLYPPPLDSWNRLCIVNEWGFAIIKDKKLGNCLVLRLLVERVGFI